jgi:hypothetical protein
MGGSMLDISVPNIADGRCAECDQLRDRDGIAGAIDHHDRRQLLTYRDYIMFPDSESPRSAIAALAILPAALACPPGRYSGRCTPRTAPR